MVSEMYAIKANTTLKYMMNTKGVMSNEKLMHPIEVGGYRSNVPIFMEVQKPMTEFSH